MESTDQIIGRVLNGETEAYADLIRHYQRGVWTVVAAMLLDKAETEDLVQQTFVKAYRNLHRFKQGRDFGLWIKEIARNEVRQELRSRRREGSRLERYHQHLLAQDVDPANADWASAIEAALAECIAKLPSGSAEVLRQRYDLAWDFAQIARSLGRTVEATRQHLARIRLALRDCIQKRQSQP